MPITQVVAQGPAERQACAQAIASAPSMVSRSSRPIPCGMPSTAAGRGHGGLAVLQPNGSEVHDAALQLEAPVIPFDTAVARITAVQSRGAEHPELLSRPVPHRRRDRAHAALSRSPRVAPRRTVRELQRRHTAARFRAGDSSTAAEAADHVFGVLGARSAGRSLLFLRDLPRTHATRLPAAVAQGSSPRCCDCGRRGAGDGHVVQRGDAVLSPTRNSRPARVDVDSPRNWRARGDGGRARARFAGVECVPRTAGKRAAHARDVVGNGRRNPSRKQAR